ncbi:MAG: hydrogen peroxide-dependent heme synthase [Solirubrobacteraceae bacterium]
MSTVQIEANPAPDASFPAGLEYTAYAAFRVAGPLSVPRAHRASLAEEAHAALSAIDGVAARGTYDTAAYRADVDLLVWIAGPTADAVQDAFAALRRTRLAAKLAPFWSAIGVHREAEFTKSHVAAYYTGEPARRYLCVYPFVRTAEWYLLGGEERRAMLTEHGEMGREYPDVRANTTSAFGLGDYEWLLAFEADNLVRIVDLIRHLRGARARLYTKNELPFITGVRKPLTDILDALP